jgi:dihydropteroate synthase
MTINCGGQPINFSSPKVMGILNVTPDSFFDGGSYNGLHAALTQTEKMLNEGATFIDVGGMSSRPGAEIISEEEELKRVVPVVEAISKRFAQAVLSVDTIRASVAKTAVQAGAAIVNDISAGRFDEAMLPTVAALKVPFIAMHMQGLPATMQQNPQYENVVAEVLAFMQERLAACRAPGITDVVIDPGFGFGKTVEHNYALLRGLKEFQVLNCPILVGVSRKSMICKLLGVNPENALNGTTAANTLAVLNGANILRVHDVREAVEVVKVLQAYGI